ncbi:hypothetical protein GE061_003550 [Apolygus lucorum]|uniref:Uncharacterized protein n=1 Tax=Apolygus lucorum TaxID=248454 RepID=A0A6A4JUX0_APOLU|nr:hypothetical protein GE061_003550 [Apolygus lucorum]
MSRVVYFIIISIFTIWNVILVKLHYDCLFQRSRVPKGEQSLDFSSPEDFEDFDNDEGTSSGEYIVPNLVHFVKFGNESLSFIEAVCIFAALINQKPRKVYFHTDQVLYNGGKHWEVVLGHQLAQGVLEVKYFLEPSSVFGQELSEDWRHFHASDVARLFVLMTYGGIFLDGDSYIVRSLDDFRKFEFTLGWQKEGGISNQVIIAHRNARFLYEWLNCYKDYRKDEWFYNAGERPTEILKERPHLVHRVPRYLAEWVDTVNLVYLDNSTEWRKHYAIHLLINHQYLINKNLSEKATYPTTFDEDNILNYDVNIKYMALAAYPFNRFSNN